MNATSVPRFFKDILKKEFVIDEPSEIVFNQQAEERLSRLFSERRKRAECGGEEKPDLLGEITDILTERDRLERINEDLRRQNEESKTGSVEPIVRSALPILDGYDRVIQLALKHPPSEEVQNWINTLATMQTKMLQTYEKYGLRVMDPVGKKVNLDRHEVVEVLHTNSIPDETIVEVRQKGYTLNGKIIRDAKVVVAQNERG
jgi:molecular chaperone GrpE